MSVFLHHFSHLIVDSLVWLLLGILAGAACQRYIRQEWVERYVGGRGSSVFTAALSGALLPGCSMSVIPLALGLRSKGGALGSMAAFILIAPMISPHTVFYSWALLGWEATVFKTITPFFIALPLGWLLNSLEQKGAAGFALKQTETPASDSCCHTPAAPSYWQMVLALIVQIAPYYLGALALAAAASAIWGENALAGFLGDETQWSSYLISALVAIPVYVCDGGSIPLAAAMQNLAAAWGPTMTFLLAAETTCIPTIMMAPKIIGLGATVLYVLCGFILSVGGGWLFYVLLSL